MKEAIIGNEESLLTLVNHQVDILKEQMPDECKTMRALFGHIDAYKSIIDSLLKSNSALKTQILDNFDERR